MSMFDCNYSTALRFFLATKIEPAVVTMYESMITYSAILTNVFASGMPSFSAAIDNVAGTTPCAQMINIASWSLRNSDLIVDAFVAINLKTSKIPITSNPSMRFDKMVDGVITNTRPRNTKKNVSMRNDISTWHL